MKYTCVAVVMPFVATTGSNVYGQLGRRTSEQRSNSFCIVELDADITHVSCGQFHTVALTTGHRLIGWGRNSEGQLGFSSDVPSIQEPELLLSPEWSIGKVCCGEAFTMFLTLDGEVYVFGAGSCGQLGQGASSVSSLVPLQVHLSEAICEIFCGARSCFALSVSGNVFAWGESVSGIFGSPYVTTPLVLQPTKLSLGPQKTRITSIAASDSFAVYITSTCDAVVSGNNAQGQLVGVESSSTMSWRQLKIPHCIRHIACGTNHLVALLANGRVVHSGASSLSSSKGGTFQSIAIDRCCGVAAGRNRSFFLQSDGGLMCCGKNKDGQLGLASFSDAQIITPVMLPHGHHAVAVACGGRHTAVLLNCENSERDGDADKGIMNLIPMEDETLSDDEPLRSMRTVSFGRWDEDISSVSFYRAPSFKVGSPNPGVESQHAGSSSGHTPSSQHGSSRDDGDYDAFLLAKAVIAITVVVVVAGGLGWIAGKRWSSRKS
ncbi:regulator of chromosomal condensation, putative [Bodo saltans]|uniref:Regulator of chromosomal condensation, putative n=1 Tax=Bodo saltans TaxID=75058 RepID=A0A0S4J7L2_BODSA|nr:regulator of chromosomal condensation, putative [Bodo saltans]|eukprot:CUG86073.1 regulator of chromosomal condensation, putative [Bodo saltans]